MDTQVEHALIGKIYDAALQPELWPQVMKELGDLLVSPSGYFTFFDQLNPHRNLMLVTGQSEERLQEYRERWALRDMELHAPVMVRQGVGRVVTNSEMLGPDTHADYLKHVGDFYQFMQRAGIEHSVGLLLAHGDYEWGVLGFFRSKQVGPFSAEALSALQRLAEHLRRALQIHRQFMTLSDRNQRTEELLTRLATPLVLLNERAQICLANRRAGAVLKHCLALELHTTNRLRAHLRHEDDQLQRLVRAAVARSVNDGERAGGMMGLHHPQLRQPVKLSVTPLSACGPLASLAQQGIRAALFVSDPNQPREVPAEYLAEAYRLTPRESAIANALLNGRSIEQVARSAGVSVETVRSQLKSIFGKTGIDSQPRLVTLLSALTNEFVHEPETHDVQPA